MYDAQAESRDPYVWVLWGCLCLSSVLYVVYCVFKSSHLCERVVGLCRPTGTMLELFTTLPASPTTTARQSYSLASRNRVSCGKSLASSKDEAGSSWVICREREQEKHEKRTHSYRTHDSHYTRPCSSSSWKWHLTTCAW
jgi:hypothetical protein